MIAGVNFTDIGSDVNWVEYGGCWAYRTGNDEYAVVRLDTCDDENQSFAVGVRVRLSDVSERDLATCGYNDYASDYDRVYAYVQTWGASGIAGGKEFIGYAVDIRNEAAWFALMCAWTRRGDETFVR